MRVSVIIPARNAATTLGRTLAALDQQDVAEGFEVIVVDDGSTDETAAVAHAAPITAKVISQGHLGPSAARNRGVAESSGGALAFTDADCYPEPAWLREGLAALEGTDLVQGRVIANPAQHVRPFDRTVRVEAEAGLYETANLFATRALFDDLGGFEDWLGARLGKELAEDLWFGWRARRAGARIGFCDAAVVRHEVFSRGPLAYVAERSRRVYFPHIAARIPELRDEFFFRRWFLDRRSAAFDLAALAVALAAVRRSALPLAAVVPYARIAAAEARRGADKRHGVAAVDLAADAVGLVALAIGSVAARELVL